MTEIEILEAIQQFLKDEVCTRIKLQKPSHQNHADEYSLINPAVHIGWIPPELPDEENLPDVESEKIPCLIVGLDEGEIIGPEMKLTIRISAVIYNPGHYDEQGTLHPDYNGYRDLQNLISLTMLRLISATIINEKVTVNKPVKFGMYKNQPHPMWYGWITFSVSTLATPYVPSIIEQYL